MFKLFVRSGALALGCASLALLGNRAEGAAFSLQSFCGSGAGNAYAGGAAAAEDACTVWSNPAGMSHIGTNQLVQVVTLAEPSTKFRNGGSIAALNQPLGGEGGDAGGWAAIPSLFLVIPFDRRWTFGLGITVPFGLKTEYNDGWIGRYQALKSELKSINVNPALSWQVTENLAIGAGVNYQQIRATLTSNVNYSAALAQGAQALANSGAITPQQAGQIAAQTGNLDTLVAVTGDDSSWGWNVGILLDIDRNNRIGAAWRSDIKYNVSGNVDFSNPSLPTLVPASLNPYAHAIAAAIAANPQFANGGATSDVKLPGIANLSWFGQVGERWELMVDAQWTHWSTIQDLTFVRTTGAVLQSTPEHFRDAWRFSAGASYRYDPRWKFRVGAAYDQSPVQDAFRNPRLPDNDRTWLASGVQYAMTNPNLKFDLGIVYEWVNKPSIAQISTAPASVAQYGYVSGNYDNHVFSVVGQVAWSF